MKPTTERLICYLGASMINTFLASAWVQTCYNEPQTLSQTHWFVWFIISLTCISQGFITWRTFLDQSVTKLEAGGYTNETPKPKPDSGPGTSAGSAGSPAKPDGV